VLKNGKLIHDSDIEDSIKKYKELLT